MGGVSTNPPSLRPIRELNRGKRVRATSGIDASTPTAAGEQGAPGKRPAADVELVRRQPQRAPGLEPELLRLTLDRNDLLDDPVPGPDHRRAERHEVGIVHAPVVHRDREEAGRAERGRVRGQLLQVAADRLFALVDAEDRLEPRLRPVVRLSTANAERDGVGDLRVEPALVGQVKHPPPLERR